MESKAVEKLKSMVTPKITIDACEDIGSGIKAEIRYSYQLKMKGQKTMMNCGKVFTVLAEKDGTVHYAPGML